MGKRKITCNYCKDIEHDVKHCEILKDEKLCKTKERKANNAIVCNYCKQTDHTIEKCDKLKEKRKKSTETKNK